MSKIIKTATVHLTSNKDEVLKACAEQIYLGLAGIGEEAEGHAKSECPVDTGRLRDSVTYATKLSQGRAGSKAQENDAKPMTTPEDFSVSVGTNVEYARYVEYRDTAAHITGKAHFLRDSMSRHTDRYINILKAALEAGKT